MLTPRQKSSDELTAVVEELLNSLSNKFAGVSSEIFAKSRSGAFCNGRDG